VELASGGGFAVVGPYNYTEEGSYPVTVSISNLSGDTATANSTVNVADAPLTATGNPLTVTQGTPFSGQVAAFTDGNFSSDVTDLSATIDWGDSSGTTSGTITFSTSGASGVVYDVAGDHTYSQGGTYTATVSIADTGGSSTSTTTPVLVVIPTTTSLSAPDVTYGAHGQVTVTVAASSPSEIPSGSVSLTVDSTSYSASLSSGTATFDVGGLGAGDHALSASYLIQGDFGPSSATGTLHVDPAILTLTALNQVMNHGDPVPALTYTITGFVNGDTSSVVSGSPTLSTTATSSSTPGYYPITVGTGTLSAANYTFNLVNGSVIVQPKVLDVHVDYGSRSMSLIGLARDLPFIDIQSIDVIFSDNVSASLGELSLNGVNVSSYSFSGMTYDPTAYDATWTLTAPLADDRLALALSGVTFAGDATISVNPFSTTFAVLPGDFNGDGVVNSQDLVGVRNEIQGKGDPGQIGWADIDGNGVVNPADLKDVRKNLGRHLPSGGFAPETNRGLHRMLGILELIPQSRPRTTLLD
jgi:hypothetical protein